MAVRHSRTLRSQNNSTYKELAPSHRGRRIMLTDEHTLIAFSLVGSDGLRLVVVAADG